MTSRFVRWNGSPETILVDNSSLAIQDPRALGETWAPTDLGGGCPVNQRGLVTVRASAVTFCASLAVAKQHIVPQTSRKGAFAVLSGHHDQHLPITAVAVRSLPAEYCSHNRGLPVRQQERFASTRAFDKRQAPRKELHSLFASLKVVTEAVCLFEWVVSR